jgi:hypothetical protein
LWGVLVAGAAAGAISHGKLGPMALSVPAVPVALLALLGAVPGLASTARPRECGRHVWHCGDPEPNHPSVWPYY